MTLARAVLSLLCVASVLAPAFAQKPKAMARQLKSSLRAVDEKPKTGKQIVEVVERLGKVDSAVAAKALLDAVMQIEKLAVPIAEKRRKSLLSEGGSGRLKRSRYELINLEDAAEAIGIALQGMKSKEALRVMLRRVTDQGSTIPLWLRLQLAARVAEVPASELDWRPTDRKGKKEHDDATLLAMLTATASLGRRAGESGSGDWVVKRLQHDNLDVRLAAVKALGQLAWPGGIEPLIGCLGRDDLAMREAALDALMNLTSQNPGGSAASWRAWLAAEGKPFLAGEVPLGRGKPKPRKGDGKPKEDKTVSGTFFGIEQNGASILYVFDNSLSMKALLGKKPKPDAPTTGPARQSRWDVCRRELAASLRTLTPEKKFNLVSFANKARCFAPAMQQATKENVERAVAWVNDLELEFETNVYDALELAFVLAGRGTSDCYYQSEVDTIFFLSDGAPTIPNLGKAGIHRDDAERILRAVARWNALGRITIHTVGLGLQDRRKERNPQGQLFPVWFLKWLAEQNHGSYKGVRQ